MTKDELKSVLLNQARARVARENREFTPQALDEIIRFINVGVNTMSESDVNNNVYVNIAQDGVNKLLNGATLILERRDRGSRYLTSTDIQNSRASICPLWPFC